VVVFFLVGRFRCDDDRGGRLSAEVQCLSLNVTVLHDLCGSLFVNISSSHSTRVTGEKLQNTMSVIFQGRR